jgi:NAD(P)-dependent dehydrogenase (short-subunit alcohol dehydrogenase family)
MKSVLITGANRGIGLGHARAYAERGAEVYATARDPASADDLNALARKHPSLRVLAYDAADPTAADSLKAEFKDAPLDLLFANAGVIGGERQHFDNLDPEGVVETFRINALAPLQLARAFAKNVARSNKRVMAFQTSLMGSIEDNGSGGYYSYRASKASLNMFVRSLSRDLASDRIIAVTLHPGWVRTRMGGGSAKLTIEDCVAAQQRLLDRATLKESGRFFNYDGVELPW